MALNSKRKPSKSVRRSSGNFESTYYRTANKNQRVPHKVSLLRYVFGLLIVTILGVFFYVMSIENITIEGDITKQQARSLEKQATSEYMFMWQIYSNDKLAKIKRPDGVASFKVSGDWLGREVIITAEPAVPALIWQTNERHLAVDRQGNIITAVGEASSFDLPLVKDESNLPVSEGEKILPRSFIKFTHFIADSDLELADLSVIDTTSELYATTQAGYYIRFDTTADPELQLDNVNRVIAVAEADGRSIREYIDVRLPYRVYYR